MSSKCDTLKKPQYLYLLEKESPSYLIEILCIKYSMVMVMMGYNTIK